MSSTSSSSSSSTSKKSIPWLSLYRPRFLSDIVGNSDIINRLSSIAKSGNLPHLILAGPPGCGKTTAVHCLSDALLRDVNGKSIKSRALLELNASDDRGLSVVRNDIKNFCAQQVALRQGQSKIVFLDEVDSMTSSAQQSLRRVIEKNEKNTRFCLACNISSKIIEPIQSRCVILRFSRVMPEAMVLRLQYILHKEKAKFTTRGLAALILTAEGDMRQLINNAQATVAGYEEITEDNVFKVCDAPHPEKVTKIITLCCQGKTSEAISGLNELWKNGHSSIDLLKSAFTVTKYMTPEEIPEYLQMEYVKLIGNCHMKAIDGLDTLVQLKGLIGKMCQISQKWEDGVKY